MRSQRAQLFIVYTTVLIDVCGMMCEAGRQTVYIYSTHIIESSQWFCIFWFIRFCYLLDYNIELCVCVCVYCFALMIYVAVSVNGIFTNWTWISRGGLYMFVDFISLYCLFLVCILCVKESLKSIIIILNTLNLTHSEFRFVYSRFIWYILYLNWVIALTFSKSNLLTHYNLYCTIFLREKLSKFPIFKTKRYMRIFR